MKYSSAFLLIGLITILLLVGGYTLYLQERNTVEELAVSPASRALQTSSTSAPLRDFAGNDANLQTVVGQVLIVNSWASWSPASVTELQLLAEVAAEYREQGVSVVAINRAESKSTAESFLAQLGLISGVQLVVDADDHYYQTIGGYTMPETIFYNQLGAVVLHKRGPLSEAEVRLTLDQILATAEQ